MKYYSLKKIKEKNADYNLIIGERSNGKTYSCKKEICENAWNDKTDGAIIRRYEEDFKGKRGQKLFKDLVENGEIERITGGVYNNVIYRSMMWFFAKTDVNTETGETETLHAQEPFCYGFALSSTEHDKSTTYPNIQTVVFDEFLTRDRYLVDEFVLFMNTLSTIIRQRDGVKIYMLGNTVNRYSTYFVEMGLTNVKNQQPNTIDVYTYGESGLTVAVEMCGEHLKHKKKSNKYFAFNNPKLEMITGGKWEIDIYPHLEKKYKPKNIMLSYFIEFDEEMLQADIVSLDGEQFTYIHRKTTPVKKYNDIVFSPTVSSNPNRYVRINRPVNRLTEKIYQFYKRDKVFYQDNEVGEIVRNYLKNCG